MAECGNKPKRIAFGIAPLGIVSIGVVPMGVVSIGVVPMGVVSLGVVGMGVLNACVVGMGVVVAGRMAWGSGHSAQAAVINTTEARLRSNSCWPTPAGRWPLRKRGNWAAKAPTPWATSGCRAQSIPASSSNAEPAESPRRFILHRRQRSAPRSRPQHLVPVAGPARSCCSQPGRGHLRIGWTGWDDNSQQLTPPLAYTARAACSRS
jgi:hypothetical protein